MRFSYTVSHVPGKQLTVADTLSRAPNDDKDTSDEQFQQKVEAFVNLVLQQLPASESRLKEIISKMKLANYLSNTVKVIGQNAIKWQAVLSLTFQLPMNYQCVMAYY